MPVLTRGVVTDVVTVTALGKPICIWSDDDVVSTSLLVPMIDSVSPSENV